MHDFFGFSQKSIYIFIKEEYTIDKLIKAGAQEG